MPTPARQMQGCITQGITLIRICLFLQSGFQDFQISEFCCFKNRIDAITTIAEIRQ